MPYWTVTVTATGRVMGSAEIVVEAANEKQARAKALMLARMNKGQTFEPDDGGIEWGAPYDTDDVCYLPPKERK
jgi:hypothetical protein